METTSLRFNSNAASIFQFSPPCEMCASARAKKRGPLDTQTNLYSGRAPHARRSAPTCRRLRRPHVTCGAPVQSTASAGQEKSMRAANGAVIGNARPFYGIHGTRFIQIFIQLGQSGTSRLRRS